MTPKYKVRRARIEYFPAYFLGSIENTVNIKKKKKEFEKQRRDAAPGQCEIS